MAFNLQHHFLNGLGVVSLFLKAVSNVLAKYCLLINIITDSLTTIVFFFFSFHKLSAEHLLRTDPVEDKEGFFIALFVKKSITRSLEQSMKVKPGKRNTIMNYSKCMMPFPYTRLSKLLIHPHMRLRTSNK